MQKQRQITDHILMIRPVMFGFNPEAAVSNSFQDKSLEGEDLQADARREFDQFVVKLRAVLINVTVVVDTLEPPTPDSIFPNNWLSFHDANGSIKPTAITYPMAPANRRTERRFEIVEGLFEEAGLAGSFRHIDLTASELQEDPSFLEGTGSLILDRVNKIAYAAISPRTDPVVLKEFERLTGYSSVSFHTHHPDTNDEIYHTNVLMALGESTAVVCFDVIPNLEEREELQKSLEANGKTIVEISVDQMNHFAGNMLQVRSSNGDSYWVMSDSAFASLDSNQIEKLSRNSSILHSDINTIERAGGGSARCMMAEVFLKG